MDCDSTNYDDATLGKTRKAWKQKRKEEKIADWTRPTRVGGQKKKVTPLRINIYLG